MAGSNVDVHGGSVPRGRARSTTIALHEPVLLAENAKHSTREARYLVLGRSTVADRRLAVIFTVRRDLVHVISARYMTAVVSRS